MAELNLDQIDRIQARALDIFYYEQLRPVYQGEKLIRFNVDNEKLVLRIVDIISDAGLTYLSTFEDLANLWANLRAEDETGVADWLIQASINWQLQSFSSHEQYAIWCERLAVSYSSHSPDSFDRKNAAKIQAYIATDDEKQSRLPKFDEQQSLFYANPWLTYLATLEMSMPRIINDIYHQFTYQGE